MMAAQNEARAAHNDEIRPAHLILGLLSEPDALAAQAIVAQGVPLEAVRQAATDSLPPAVDILPELIPYDAQSREVLELTFREGLRMGHNYIGTEHILLALLEWEDGTGLLSGFGIRQAPAEAVISKALAAAAQRRI